MKAPIIKHDAIWSPYCVFVRCGELYDDRFLLEAVGATDYAFNPTPTFDDHSVFVTGSEDWVHIAEGLSFRLCPGPDTVPGVCALAGQHELFTFTTGDADMSYSFEYHREGRLHRRLVVDDPTYRGGVVMEDIGEVLPCEPVHPMKGELIDALNSLARGIGIHIHHTRDSLRAYTLARR